MLSPSKRIKVKEIIERISNGHPISLRERLLIHKYAQNDQSISSWLNKAQRRQQQQSSNDELDLLLNDLDLGSADPQSIYRPDQDDLGEWFSGAPPWISRS